MKLSIARVSVSSRTPHDLLEDVLPRDDLALALDEEAQQVGLHERQRGNAVVAPDLQCREIDARVRRTRTGPASRSGRLGHADHRGGPRLAAAAAR